MAGGPRIEDSQQKGNYLLASNVLAISRVESKKQRGRVK